MFTKDILKLSWEWPADRPLQQKILVIVNDIKKEKNASISNSASMDNYLPDPVVLTAHVLEGDMKKGTRLSLRLPNMELDNISLNDHVAIGLIQNNICICIEKAPEDLDKKAVDTWFSSWTCS